MKTIQEQILARISKSVEKLSDKFKKYGSVKEARKALEKGEMSPTQKVKAEQFKGKERLKVNREYRKAKKDLGKAKEEQVEGKPVKVKMPFSTKKISIPTSEKALDKGRKAKKVSRVGRTALRVGQEIGQSVGMPSGWNRVIGEEMAQRYGLHTKGKKFVSGPTLRNREHKKIREARIKRDSKSEANYTTKDAHKERISKLKKGAEFEKAKAGGFGKKVKFTVKEKLDDLAKNRAAKKTAQKTEKKKLDKMTGPQKRAYTKRKIKGGFKEATAVGNELGTAVKVSPMLAPAIEIGDAAVKALSSREEIQEQILAKMKKSVKRIGKY